MRPNRSDRTTTVENYAYDEHIVDGSSTNYGFSFTVSL